MPSRPATVPPSVAVTAIAAMSFRLPGRGRVSRATTALPARRRGMRSRAGGRCAASRTAPRAET
ncbi:hypothetical protein ACWDXU_26550 [Nocardia sp. NPDC003167]